MHVREPDGFYAERRDDHRRITFENQARKMARAVGRLYAKPDSEKKPDVKQPADSFEQQRQLLRLAVSRSRNDRRVMDGIAHAAEVARQLRILPEEEIRVSFRGSRP